MTSVLDVLRDRGYGDVDEAALVRAVQEALPLRADREPGAAPDAGQRFLQEHSGIRVSTAAVAGAGQRLVARRIADAARTLDTAAVADLLGVHRTRVQHLREHGDLYAYRDGRSNRYPWWQFTDQQRPLPGLRQVLAALGPVHRSVVTGFMTTAQPDLDTGDGPASARDWLAAGQDPHTVVELAHGAAQPW